MEKTPTLCLDKTMISKQRTRSTVNPKKKAGTRTRTAKSESNNPVLRPVPFESPVPSAHHPELLKDIETDFETLLNAVQKLEDLGFKFVGTGPGLEIVRKTRRFLTLIVDLMTLRRGFMISPNRKIAGVGGVAATLGINKNTVVLRMRELGIPTNEIRNPVNGLDTLIEKSKPIKEARGEVIKLARKYFSGESQDS